MKKIKTIIFSLLIFAIGFGIVSAWTGPTANPPTANISAPINVGSNFQTKEGSFQSNTDIRAPKYWDYPSTDYYLDLGGNSKLLNLFSEEVRAGIFYDWNDYDYWLNPAGVSVLKTIKLGGEERSTWPEGGSSLWTQSDSNIYRNTGNVGIGTASPGAKLDVWDGNLYLSDTDVAHGMTGQGPTSLFGRFSPLSTTDGGLDIRGYSDTDATGLQFVGAIGSTDPTNTIPAVLFLAGKKSTTNPQAVADAETAYQFRNWGTNLVTILGSGNVGIGTTAPGAKLSFNNLNDGTDADGITWYSPTPLSYGIYRSEGTWSSPNYQQLTLKWATGIVIDGGSSYGRSGTVLQPNGGNVGIGKTNPGYNLHIAKEAAASATLGGAPAVLMLEQDDNTNWSGGEAAAEILFKKGGDIVGAIRSEHTRAGGPHSNEDAGLTFYVAPSSETPVAYEAMRITSTGLVGIGTITPTEKLDVAGYVKGTGLCIETDCRTTWPTTGIITETDPQVGTLYNGYWCTSNGSTVNCTSSAPSVSESDTLATVTARGNTTNSWMQSNSSMRAPLFYDSNNTDYYVDPSSLSKLFSVRTGTLYATSFVDYINPIYNIIPRGASVLYKLFVTNNVDASVFRDKDDLTYTYYVDPNGTSNVNALYRTYGYIDYEYDVNNTAYYVNPNSQNYLHILYFDSAAQVSDISLKKNVQGLKNSLDKILKLEGVSFEWKDEERGKGNNLGLIAQDVEKVYPELVSTDEKTGLKVVQYANLVAPLIEAVKELSSTTNQQQQQIEELKNEIEILKNK